MATDARPFAKTCFHCGLEIPDGFSLMAIVKGEPQPMCCAGCCAVAEMLDAQGLSGWYTHRETAAGAPPESVPDVLARTAYLEIADLEAEFATRSDDGSAAATLLVDGLRCAACVWVIERHLESLEGVRSVRVNGATRRAHVVWDPARRRLRDLIVRLAEIGFVARPDRPGLADEMDRQERRAALIRIGVSGLGTMNVMTYAVGLYLGVVDGMEPGVRNLLRWACLLVATPVVFVGARPFFEAAVRDLRIGRPGMDVPVSLAIGGAYLISAWAVLRGSGEIYLESACMFTFFLSLGRYLEMSVRHRSGALTRSLLDASPAIARLLEGEAGGGDGDGDAKANANVKGSHDVERIVPARSLARGDRFVVRPGEAIAADGRVVEGRSSVEAALLTGEPWPRQIEAGGEVLAGSINLESPLVVEATRVSGETTLAAIVALVERAQTAKPPIAAMADRVAAVFVSVVLVVAALCAAFWGWSAPERAIEVTLAVLVATCPCALGLATPTALAAATQALAKAGLLLTQGHALEGLARADRIVFDKTGTLTLGHPSLEHVVPLRGDASGELVAIAGCLEQRSEHPIARALVAARDAYPTPEPTPDPTSDPTSDPKPHPTPQAIPHAALPEMGAVPAELVSVPGSGMAGRLAGVPYRIGRPDWAIAIADPSAAPAVPVDAAHSWVLMVDAQGPLAWFGFADPLRAEAAEVANQLHELGLELEMLSGDPSAAAARVADALGLEVEVPAAAPSDKVERIRALQAQGQVVVAVGDGVNDGPVLRAADISVAMGSGSDLAQVAADGVLVHDDLSRLPLAIRCARRTRRVIIQNFSWAIAYNLCALPLALGGFLAPWLAAAGMSISSLVVVLNATRLARLEVAR